MCTPVDDLVHNLNIAKCYLPALMVREPDHPTVRILLMGHPCKVGIMFEHRLLHLSKQLGVLIVRLENHLISQVTKEEARAMDED